MLSLARGSYIGDQGWYGSTWSFNTYRNNSDMWHIIDDSTHNIRSAIQQGGSGILFFIDNETDNLSPNLRMEIDGETGNVGISIANPDSRLDVGGEVEISDTNTGLNPGTNICINYLIPNYLFVTHSLPTFLKALCTPPIPSLIPPNSRITTNK